MSAPDFFLLIKGFGPDYDHRLTSFFKGVLADDVPAFSASLSLFFRHKTLTTLSLQRYSNKPEICSPKKAFLIAFVVLSRSFFPAPRPDRR